MSKWIKEPVCMPTEAEHAFGKENMPVLSGAYDCIMQAIGITCDGSLEKELSKKWSEKTARKIAKELDEVLVFHVAALMGEIAIRYANSTLGRNDPSNNERKS